MKARFTALLFLAVAAVYASEPAQVGFWFDVPPKTTNSTVDGVKIGLPVSSGRGAVNGAELSLCYSSTANVYGFQWAWIGATNSKKFTGLQLSFLNFITKSSEGLQVGFFNHSNRRGFQWGFINNCADNARFQLGFININKNGWLPIMIFVNFGADTFK